MRHNFFLLFFVDLMQLSHQSSYELSVLSSISRNETISEVDQKINNFIDSCIKESEEIQEKLEKIYNFFDENLFSKESFDEINYFDRLIMIVKCLTQRSDEESKIIKNLQNLKKRKVIEYPFNFADTDNLIYNSNDKNKLKDQYEEFIKIFELDCDGSKLLNTGCDLLASLFDLEQNIKRVFYYLNDNLNERFTKSFDYNEVCSKIIFYLGFNFKEVNFIFVEEIKVVLIQLIECFTSINEFLNNEFKNGAKKTKYYEKIKNRILVLENLVFPLNDFLENNLVKCDNFEEINANDRNLFCDLCYNASNKHLNLKKIKIINSYNLYFVKCYEIFAEKFIGKKISQLAESSGDKSDKKIKEEVIECFIEEFVSNKTFKRTVKSRIKRRIENIKAKVQNINKEIINYAIESLKIEDSEKERTKIKNKILLIKKKKEVKDVSWVETETWKCVSIKSLVLTMKLRSTIQTLLEILYLLKKAKTKTHFCCCSKKKKTLVEKKLEDLKKCKADLLYFNIIFL